MRSLSVRQLRERLGLSVEQFARRIPVTERTIYRWEADEVLPSPLAMHRLREVEREVMAETQRNTSAAATAAFLRSK